MANPTSNFNWQMPTPTDLVTDLPADFEVFGQAVDSSMADLLGGTTGQILAKNSNTNMDFVWVTNDQGDITAVTAGTGITGGGTSGAVTVTNSMATTITTKGDLVPGTGSGTFARLAAGSNGETLVADSSTSTGLRYTAGTVQANPVLNSAFQIWQRGTSFTNGNSTTTYGADRWHIFSATSTGRTWSRQTTNDTTNLPFIQYCLRAARNSGDTQTNNIFITSDFESINSIPFAGRTVTISFYARAGANFSSTSNGLQFALVSGTGTDQNSLSGFTGSTLPFNGTVGLTTTWQRFTVNASIPSTSTQLGMQIGYSPTGTAGANDWFEITGVQIDIGSVALPFRTYAGTIQGELAACQRYYFLKASGTDLSYGMAAYNSGSDLRGSFSLPVEMRIAPTLIAASGTNFYIGMNSDAFNSLTQQFTSKTEVTWYNVSEVSGTAGYGMPVRTNNASSSIALSAEL